MNLKKLLAHLEQFPLRDLAESSWEVSNILAAIYGRTLEFTDYDSTAAAAFENLRGFEVRRVFDIEHSSDEECYVDVVTFNGQPFALVHKFGDRAEVSHSVINGPVFKELGKQIASLLAEARLQAELDELSCEADAAVTTLSELRNGYLTWISDELGLFTVDHPSGCLWFRDLPKTYTAVTQDEEGQLHLVKKILGSEPRNTPDQFSRDEVRVQTEDGQEFVVNGQHIAFFLVTPEAPLQAAQTCISKRTSWKLSGVLTRCVVRIAQYYEGVLGATNRTFVIHNDNVMRAFVSRYKDTVNLEVFQPEGRDFDKL